MIVMGVDPGISHTGVVLIDFHDSSSYRASGALVIETTLRLFSKTVLASDDVFIRARSFYTKISSVLSSEKVSLICMESFSPVRSSFTSSKNAFIYGVLAAVCEGQQLPVCSMSPQAVRDCLFPSFRKIKKAGEGKISKEEIQEYVKEKVPGLSDLLKDIKKKSLHEHICDAAAVVMASMSTDYFRLLMGR